MTETHHMSGPPERRAFRPTVLGPRAMVATPHSLASAAGLRVLHAGGNAIDPAIAAAAVCSVVYPHMCSIGGAAFWLIYNARTATERGLNGSGRSGVRCSIDQYQKSGYTAMAPSVWRSASSASGIEARGTDGSIS